MQGRDGSKKLAKKSQFALSWSSSRLFLLTYFVKHRRTLLLIVEFLGTNLVSKREIKFHRRLFTPSYWAILRRSRAKKAKKCTKKCDARANFFPLLKLFFYDRQICRL